MSLFPPGGRDPVGGPFGCVQYRRRGRGILTPPLGGGPTASGGLIGSLSRRECSVWSRLYLQQAGCLFRRRSIDACKFGGDAFLVVVLFGVVAVYLPSCDFQQHHFLQHLVIG